MESTQTIALPADAPPYVGRFAPSPTGPLHFGSLVTAVASYADARSARGQWLLRIEDVDKPRCSSLAELDIRRQLAAYGFEHDGEIARQSERGGFYDAALMRLANANHLFACTCTRKQLEAAPRNREGETIYPGTCRSRMETTEAARALRMRVPSSIEEPVAFTDRACGTISQSLANEVGDFVLRRADGLYAYQLAVVVDDALQGVTHVVRGEDLLLNTPRQIFLQRALGYLPVTYMHVPLVCNKQGEKLSKQTLAPAISVDDVLPTLHRAWAFLKQPSLGHVESIGTFWRRAAEVWTPALLCARN